MDNAKLIDSLFSTTHCEMADTPTVHCSESLMKAMVRYVLGCPFQPVTLLTIFALDLSARSKGDYSDATIKTDGEEIKIIKAVVCLQSDVFDKMFTSGFEVLHKNRSSRSELMVF